MDTFNAFNPEPEVEKSRWLTGPAFTMLLVGFVAGFAVNSFVGRAPDGGVLTDDASLSLEETAALSGAVGADSTEKKDAIPLFGFGGKKEEKEKIAAPVAEGENILVVSNQPSGERVIISMVSIGANGWVAVHESYADGSLGSILGARRFNAGKYFGETIELLRGTVEDGTYVVVLHADDDGDSEFDYVREVPMKDKAGNLISGTFIATPLVLE